MNQPIAQRLLSVLLPGIFLAASACGAIGFDVGQDLPEQRVQGSPLAGVLPSFLPSPVPLDIDLKVETEKRGTGPATAAYLKAISLTTETPGANFDFLDELRVQVAQRGGGSLPPVEVARLVPVPKGLKQLELVIIPNVDLLPYINAGAAITASARGTQPRNDLTYKGRVTLTIRI